MEIIGTAGAEVVRGALDALITDGRLVESRHGTALELTGVTVVVKLPTNTLVVRKGFERRLAAAEALHLISGLEYGPRIRAITAHLDSRRWDSYAPSFGRRLRLGLAEAVVELSRHPNTRQAYVPIWRPSDLKDGRADYLCATGLQFLLRRGELELVVTWRSNDAWHGLPYNLFAFGQLQATVARVVGARLGRLVFNVGSLHLYLRHQAWAREAVELIYPGSAVNGVGSWRETDAQTAWLDATRRAAALLRGPVPLDPTPSEAALAELLG